MITQNRANELLRYDPSTGYLYWRVAHKNNVRAGDRAGSLNTPGHIQVSIDSQRYLAHRLVWLMNYERFPKQIDHIDHDKTNNKLENLRDVTHGENQRNLSMRSTNTSGVTGVCWYKARGKWQAQIVSKGKSIHLGYFKKIEDAKSVRKAAEKEHGFHPNHGLMLV